MAEEIGTIMQTIADSLVKYYETLNTEDSNK